MRLAGNAVVGCDSQSIEVSVALEVELLGCVAAERLAMTEKGERLAMTEGGGAADNVGVGG